MSIPTIQFIDLAAQTDEHPVMLNSFQHPSKARLRRNNNGSYYSMDPETSSG
jgi:hypothetical protein